MRQTRVTQAFLSVAAAIAALTVVVRGQQQPTFRGGIELVEVDAIVLDGRGRAVKDLTAADFEVLEDGKPQPVSTFAFVDVPVAPLAAAAGVETSEPDITTNTSEKERRLWVMLLDTPVVEVNTFMKGGGVVYTRLTQNVARRFVDEAVGPDDLLAVIHVQGSQSASQPFTTSKALALRSIERFGSGPGFASEDPSERTPEERVAMMMNTYRTIQDVSLRLGAMSTRRKAVIWIGGQLAFDPSGQGPDAFGFAAPTLLAAYRDAVASAQRNHVAIYPVDPSGMSTDLNPGLPQARGTRQAAESDLVRRGALRIAAEDTGGYAVVGTNDFERGFAQIRDENSSYYVLGYYPPVQHADGRFHAITVRVKRPGLTVRSRKGYTAPTDATKSTAAGALAASAAEALRNPLPAAGLRISLFATPFKGAATPGIVIVGAHIRGEGLSPTGENVLQVAYRVIDDEGKVVTTRTSEYKLPDDAEQRALIQRDGARFIEELALPQGRFEIRCAVSQRGGSVGSVVAYVDVPDFTDGPIAMSGLLVESRGSTVTPRIATQLAMTLNAEVTALREFPARGALAMSGVVYADADLPADGVLIEPFLLDAAGNVLGEVSKALQVRGRTAAGGQRQFEVEVPLGSLTPGAYVFKLSARVATDKRGVERAVPFRVTQN